jgi:hypothetical protein
MPFAFSDGTCAFCSEGFTPPACMAAFSTATAAAQRRLRPCECPTPTGRCTRCRWARTTRRRVQPPARPAGQRCRPVPPHRPHPSSAAAGVPQQRHALRRTSRCRRPGLERTTRDRRRTRDAGAGCGAGRDVRRRPGDRPRRSRASAAGLRQLHGACARSARGPADATASARQLTGSGAGGISASRAALPRARPAIPAHVLLPEGGSTRCRSRCTRSARRSPSSSSTCHPS